ncbi:hypothetical protein MASR2M18_20700 [Ignavibacteria bacterium]|nr:hypothetical protein [Bacteroidota bacterium]MCZ2131964.1 hypothetical protein [Bacteroidota bacterium]
MLGFSIRRGRLLRKRRRIAATRLTLVMIFAACVAVFTAEWREYAQSEASLVAADFPIIAVFPTNTDSTEAAFTARQFGALYYIGESLNIPAVESWNKISAQISDLDEITEGNPLPATARITLRPEYCSREIIQEAVAELRRIAPDCEVKFDAVRAEYAVSRIENINRLIYLGLSLPAIFIALLLYFALRAERLSDPDEDRALAAMGAGRLFMALPHIVFAVISGVYGLVTVLAFRYVATFLPNGIPLVPTSSFADTAVLSAAVFGIYAVLSVATSFSRVK